MNREATYLQHLDSIKRIAAFVARRKHVSADETDEFVQIACVRLWENDYAIIGKFEGRSEFTTYLTTVILRLFHQWRVEQWGKWRPSAEAKRLGEKAIVLERLMSRDGYTFAEAVSLLTMRSGGEFTIDELEDLYERLPRRSPRTQISSGEIPAEAFAVPGDAEERAGAPDRKRTAKKAGTALQAVWRTLASEDQVILRMRFWNEKTVPEISRALTLDQKKVYKRLDKLFATLRRAMESAGVSKADVEMLLTSGDQEIWLGILSHQENPPFRPSNHPDGEGKPQ